MATSRGLTDLFRFPGFRPYATARGGVRRPEGACPSLGAAGKKARCGICDTLVHGIYLELELRRVGRRCCGGEAGECEKSYIRTTRPAWALRSPVNIAGKHV